MQIPDWVPEPAQHRIVERLCDPGTSDAGRALLKRLATYPAMKTEVWERLPAEPGSIQRDVIDWALFAFTIFPLLRRPFPKGGWREWNEWGKHLHEHPPLSEPASVYRGALLLSQEMISLKPATDLYWGQFWKGPRSVTLDQVLEILRDVQQFYGELDALFRAELSAMPQVKRWGRKGAQKFFSEYLSRHISDACGQPHDAIVATLTEVTFNLEESIDTETIRGRRRVQCSTGKI